MAVPLHSLVLPAGIIHDKRIHFQIPADVTITYPSLRLVSWLFFNTEKRSAASYIIVFLFETLFRLSRSLSVR